MSARVDIGIPTIGRSHYIVEAIESVLAQTYTDWRLIVSEDGPGDGLPEVRKRVPDDSRIVYGALGRAEGAARHMNALVEAGTAPYVALLHDDDRWDPEFLERRVAFLDAHPDCALVFSACAVIDERGRRIGAAQSRLPYGRIETRTFLPKITRRNLIPTPTVLVRRSAYEAVGGFEPSFPVIYDYEMWIRIAARFPVGVLGTCDAGWRLHGAQATYDPAHLRSAEYGALLARIDELIPPELVPRRHVRRRNLADRLLFDAVNALLRAERRHAVRHVGSAVRCYPPCVIDPRVTITLLASLLGRAGRRGVESTAWVVRRRQLRVHREAR